jgi:hypothetical protein
MCHVNACRGCGFEFVPAHVNWNQGGSCVRTPGMSARPAASVERSWSDGRKERPTAEENISGNILGRVTRVVRGWSPQHQQQPPPPQQNSTVNNKQQKAKQCQQQSTENQ